MPNPATPADRAQHLSVTRFIAASPADVWTVLVDRQEEWFCPKPWRVEIIEQERRAGGRSRMVMHGPGGERAPNDGIYLAWDEGRRIVATDAAIVDAEGAYVPAGPFMIGTWELAHDVQHGIAGTLYTASARHWTEEARKQHEAMGFVAGWQACADQLAALCEAG